MEREQTIPDEVNCPHCGGLTSTVDRTEEFWCPSCEEIIIPDKKYECRNCGTIFTRENSADGSSHRCPDCNKFGTLVAENGCPDCDDETDLEEVTLVVCQKCRELFPLDSALQSSPTSDPSKHRLSSGDMFKLLDKDGNLIHFIRIDKVKDGKPVGKVLITKPSLSLWNAGDHLATNPFICGGSLDGQTLDLSQYVPMTQAEEERLFVEVNNKSIDLNKALLQKAHYLYQCPDCGIIKPIPKAEAESYESQKDPNELYCGICRSKYGLAGKGTDYHRMTRIG